MPYVNLGDLPAAPLTSLPSSASDTDLGNYALTAFWKAAYPLNPQLTDDWVSFLDRLRRAYYPRDASEAPQGYPKAIFYPNKSSEALEAFFDGFGFSLRSVELDQDPSKIQHAMVSLAAAGHGTIPVDSNSFFHAIQNEAQDFSFFDAAAFVAKASASQIAEGAQKVGEGIIDTGKDILSVRRYLLIAAALLGAYILYKRYGSAPAKRKPGLMESATEFVKSKMKANPKKRRKKLKDSEACSFKHKVTKKEMALAKKRLDQELKRQRANWKPSTGKRPDVWGDD